MGKKYIIEEALVQKISALLGSAQVGITLESKDKFGVLHQLAKLSEYKQTNKPYYFYDISFEKGGYDGEVLQVVHFSREELTERNVYDILKKKGLDPYRIYMREILEEEYQLLVMETAKIDEL